MTLKIKCFEQNHTYISQWFQVRSDILLWAKVVLFDLKLSGHTICEEGQYVKKIYMEEGGFKPLHVNTQTRVL